MRLSRAVQRVAAKRSVTLKRSITLNRSISQVTISKQPPGRSAHYNLELTRDEAVWAEAVAGMGMTGSPGTPPGPHTGWGPTR